MTKLFNSLPEHLFAPLAGPNRAVYAAVLEHLHGVFFEHPEASVFPAYETVRAEIEECIARLARVQWVDEDEEERALPQNHSGLALRVYRRLRSCGWLEEEPEGYRKSVVISPDVGTLLDGLVELSRGQRIYYGGRVLSIHNNVKSAAADPQNQALALREAARDARRFARHLAGMVYGLRGLLAQLAGLADPRTLLESFFDDFVEQFLVADYKRLKTQNNPFRHRSDIVQNCNALRFDPLSRARFASAYAEQMQIDEERAGREFDSDLTTLLRTFETIDQQLARLDRYRYRFERRAAEAVRYMDSSLPGTANRIAVLLRGLGERLPAQDEATTPGELEQLGGIPPLAQSAPLSAHSLRPLRGRRTPPEPAALQRRTVDEDKLGRQQQLRDYMARRRIDPRRIEDYLKRHFDAGQPALAAADFAIDNVEDYIAFTHLRHLGRLGPGAARLARRYRAETLDDEFENDYLRCPNFRIAQT